MLDKLINVILQQAKFSNEEIALCSQYFQPLVVAKNTIVAAAGKIPQYLYFVAEGFLRLYYVDENGDEQTSYFCQPDGFIASFFAFIHQNKATENIEAISNCQLLKISHSDLKKLIDSSENFKQFSLRIFEQALQHSTVRANDLATLNAEQRYKKLLTTQPAWIQNIPIQHLASYLGIKPESLSRIRRQIIF